MNANFDHVEALTQDGVEEDVALASVPWPDVLPPKATGLPNGCAGDAHLLVGSGRTCPPGQIPAQIVEFRYLAPTVGGQRGHFDMPTRDEARLRGGDTGPSFNLPLVCARAWNPEQMTTSDFVEDIPSSQVHKSPHVTGLVNLDTWVWYDFSDPASRSVTGTAEVPLHGLTITLESEIWVDKVEWDLDGDGKVDVVADAPDTGLDPATHAEYLAIGGEDSEQGGLGNFVYKKMGTYDLTTTVTWRGVYRVSMISEPGGETITFNGSRNVLNSVEVTASEPYVVRSIRTEQRHRPKG